MEIGKSQSSNLLNSLFKQLIIRISVESILYIQHTDIFKIDAVFSDIPHDYSGLDRNAAAHATYDYESVIPSEGKWDIVFGEFPFCIRTQSRTRDLALKKTAESLKLISDEGFGIFLFASYSYVFQRFDIRRLVVEENCYVNSVLNLPNGFLHPVTGLRPILVFVSRTKTNYEYIAEFDELEPHEAQIYFVVQAIVSQLDGDEFGLPSGHYPIEESDYLEIKASLSKNEEFQEDLWHGIYIEPSNFRGFEHWKINDAISRLSTDYAHYSMVKLDNLSTMINVTQGEFEHLENAVYVPLIGKQKCESDLKEVKIKHQNICQIVVNPEKVLPSYLVSFLNSDLGCRIWN